MILIINCGSTKTPNIQQIVEEIGYKCKTINLENFSIIDIENKSGIIISGAPILVTEVDTKPYINQFSFLKTIKIPVLGICFGHQILGMIFSATPQKCIADRNWQTINLIHNSLLFNNIEKPIVMIEDHCEHITVPNDFKHIASSTTCRNEAMQHHTKPLFGVQFHPEVSDTQGKQLIENFCNLC